MKKLLFFDVECSNNFGGNGKVCEFGAVITDEKFNIIKEYDIPMSPGKGRENRFDLKIYDRDPLFDWAYDKDYYFTCPEFPEYYKLIKKLLEVEDMIVFGYSVDNDIRYLSYPISKYGLSQLSYIANDIKPMIKLYSKERLQVGGLNAAFKNICGAKAGALLCPHLARDDAKMTMMIVKRICDNLEITIEELIELCPDCHYDSIEYLNQHKSKKEYKKLHPELYSKKSMVTIDKEAQTLWCDFYKENLPFLESIDCVGNIVSISSKLKESVDIIKKTIDAIKRKKLVAYNGITGSDMLIVYDEDDKNRLQSMLKHPYNGKIIMYNEFIDRKETI